MISKCLENPSTEGVDDDRGGGTAAQSESPALDDLGMVVSVELQLPAVQLPGHLGEVRHRPGPGGQVHVEVVEPDGVVVQKGVLTLGVGHNLGLEAGHRDPAPGDGGHQSASLSHLPVVCLVLQGGDEV